MTAVPLRAAIVLAALFITLGASAQPVTPSPENVFARPGYPTIGVYVLGDVQTPGKWRVEDGAPLLDLLAVTTPANPSPDRGGVVESVRVRLYRQSGAGARQLTVDSDLEPLLIGSLAATPLREGDLVRVITDVTEPRDGISFMDVLGVVSTVASVAVLVISLTQ